MRIVKAVEILSAYCEKHKCCVDCRFGKLGMEECIFQKYPPCDWYDEYEQYLKRVLGRSVDMPKGEER